MENEPWQYEEWWGDEPPENGSCCPCGTAALSLALVTVLLLVTLIVLL